MNILKMRSFSDAELAKDAARPFRFEIWREEPNTEDQPYRRKKDRRTRTVWHNLQASTNWADVFALVKRGQRLSIRTFIRRSSWGNGSWRIVSVHISNRKPTT